MNDLEIYLYPLVVFLVLGALAAWWQSRHAGEDIAARKRLLAHSFDAKRWRIMPQWDDYRAHQDDPVRHACSARYRARFFTLCACVAVAFLCLSR